MVDRTVTTGRAVRTVTRTGGNRKVGSHTVTTSRDRSSCPRDCGAWDECYGTNVTQSGADLFENVARAPDRACGPVIEFVRPGARAVRYNVVGDFLRDDGTVVDREYIDSTNAAARKAQDAGLPVWSYTHAWEPRDDREHVEPADFAYTVRASVQDPDGASRAIARGWAPAMIVADHEDPLINSMIDGRRVVLCPAQRHADVTCETCRLCATSAGVVAFAAHGAASRRIRRQTAQ